jgi:hypothetical protein
MTRSNSSSAVAAHGVSFSTPPHAVQGTAPRLSGCASRILSRLPRADSRAFMHLFLCPLKLPDAPHATCVGVTRSSTARVTRRCTEPAALSILRRLALDSADD